MPIYSTILLQYGSWMCVGNLANTALNIHYNNGGEVEAGGQDATGCISTRTQECCCHKHTHKCLHAQRERERTGHWLKIQHYD